MSRTIRRGTDWLKARFGDEKPKQKRIWQDGWFDSWFVRKNDLLHCRFIEYAWILLHLDLPPEGTILDVGCGASFFPLMFALQGYDVTAVDSHPFDYGFDSYKFIHGDASVIKLPKKYDRIMMISALEHFGIHGLQLEEEVSLDCDLKAVRNLNQYLNDDGSWVITVPFGVEHVFGSYRVYTQKRLDKLFPNIIKQEYFIRENNVWVKSTREETEKVIFTGPGDLTVTCLVANK